MTIPLYGSGAGFFDLSGVAFHAQDTARVCSELLYGAELLDVLNQFQNATNTLDLQTTLEGLTLAGSAFTAAAGSAMSPLQSYVQNLLIAMADADSPLSQRTATEALARLISQMEATSATVDACGVTITATAGSGNAATGKWVLSTRRGDGRVQENSLSEVLRVTVPFGADTDSPTFQILGESSVSLLDARWPQGSAASVSVSGITAEAATVLLNGGFEDEDDVANAPDDWIVTAGTIGTVIKMTDVEVWTVTITGSPSAGFYRLLLTNRNGQVQATGILAYNAAASDVQTAIRALVGFELVTVTATGTTPNFTHTITAVGAGGNLTQIQVDNRTTGGTLTPATSSNGDANVFRGGKALHIDSDGAELPGLAQLVTLQASTQYAVSLWAITDVVPASGEITLDLVDGIGGTVLQDESGNVCRVRLNADNLTTSWQHLATIAGADVCFRTPATLPPQVYFRLHVTVAIPNTSSIWIDEVCCEPMEQLYPGGPSVAYFAGQVNPGPADTWELAVVNDRAGEIQEWMNRNFDMAQAELLLPSKSDGTETIPDTVVSPNNPLTYGWYTLFIP